MKQSLKTFAADAREVVSGRLTLGAFAAALGVTVPAVAFAGDFDAMVTSATAYIATIVLAILAIAALIFGIVMTIRGVKYLIAALRG